MEITSEYLLNNGWELFSESVGVIDGIESSQQTKKINGKDYMIELGLFNPCMGITHGSETTFFAWDLTVERLLIIEEGLI